MDTEEHTYLVNGLGFNDWNELANNPYVQIDVQGKMLLNLQGIAENGLPEHIDLILSPGEVAAMSGDYFGGKEVDLTLPSLNDFTHNRAHYGTTFQYKNLGEYLINEPCTPGEEQKLIRSYQKLANPDVQKSEIDTIYKINNANYVPFSPILNSYIQQLMFALWVKNYGEILNRNLSHFTPWSVRTYVLGHRIALKYARLSYELNQLMKNTHYSSNNEEFNTLMSILHFSGEDKNADKLKDLAHRYQALALGMEFFCFHYYSDHYAAGHGAMMGDLRALLPERFGVLGSILVNNLHDELNRVSVYTKKPYNLNPDPTEPPIETGGDGTFNSPRNYYNQQSCIVGMQESIQDLHKVFTGHEIPEQSEYAGLARIPDIDFNYRQPQPLLLLTKDNKIYYRTDLRQIRTLSPSEFRELHSLPEKHGYTELTNSFSALLLVIKLRLFPYLYEGQLQPLTASEMQRIDLEESKLNPGRKSIPLPPVVVSADQPVLVTLPQWQRSASNDAVMKGLNSNSLLTASARGQQRGQEVQSKEEIVLSM